MSLLSVDTDWCFQLEISMRYVDNPLQNWRDMKGNTELEKYINGMLCSKFIGNHEIPDDECYYLADTFCNEKFTEDEIAYILFNQFEVCHDYKDMSKIAFRTTELSHRLIDRVAKRIYILTSQYNQYGE